MAQLTCAEGSKRKLKAYFSDFWGRAQQVYEVADKDAKEEVKKEIITLANRIIALIEREK